MDDATQRKRRLPVYLDWKVAMAALEQDHQMDLTKWIEEQLSVDRASRTSRASRLGRLML